MQFNIQHHTIVFILYWAAEFLKGLMTTYYDVMHAFYFKMNNYYNMNISLLSLLKISQFMLFISSNVYFFSSNDIIYFLLAAHPGFALT